MTAHLNRGLPIADWPSADKALWDRVSGADDLFDESPGAGWSVSTKKGLQYAYGLWLGALELLDPQALGRAPAQRVTKQAVADYVDYLRANCRETTISHCVSRLFYALRAMCPEQDWTWIYRLARRIAARARPMDHPVVYADDLLRVGFGLIERARAMATAKGHITKSCAERYRDGMLIATLVEAPMRRHPFSQLRLDEHVVREGQLWAFHVPASLTKTNVAQDYPLSARVSGYMDIYLDRFRPAFPGADKHTYLWPYEGRPMGDKMIRRRIIKRTKLALGFPVSPHRFRNAAASFVAVADPENIRMTRDLLGHKSFAMTEKHYIHGAQSRVAGQTLAQLLVRKASAQFAAGEASQADQADPMEALG